MGTTCALSTRLLRLLAALLCLPWTAAVPAQSGEPAIAIVGATLVHPERGPQDAVELDTTIVIRGERIEAVGPASAISVPGEARVIDAKGKWVIPGLIDAHVHFFLSGNYYTRPDIADFTATVPYAQEVARNRARLPQTLRTWVNSGVTGVVDVGGPMWVFEVRELARHTVEAPRVAVAGPLISTVARPSLDLGDPPIVQVLTPEQGRDLAQRELALAPDYVKMWFVYTSREDLAAQEAIARAVGEAAHAGGARFAVHATELVTAKGALRAGADLLVHSVMDRVVDDEFLALARRRNVLYCPTLFVMEGYRLALSNQWHPSEDEERLADPEVLESMGDLSGVPRERLPAGVRRMMRERDGVGASPASFTNLRKIWDAGITVVMGTDAGNIGTLHGPAVFREMEMMVEAGLTPLEVLRSATFNGAIALGMEGEVGAITPGRLADLVVLDADPLADIGNSSRIRLVMKGGAVVVEPPAP
jgi:imidazolonepropionase-like amidohydrolase